MAALLALLSVSILTRPVYTGEERPEVRSLQHILLLHAELEAAPPSITGSREAALAHAARLAAELAAGADFTTLAARHSMARDARQGAILGSFAPGMLRPELDAFLFEAEVDEVSPPLDTERGVYLLRRVETRAAARHLYLAGTDADTRGRMEALRARVVAGEDFRDLAREHSDETESAQRGGDYAIFERGPEDRLLKALAFATPVGEVSPVLPGPLGYHLIQRVPLDALEPELAEDKWVRVRAILIQDVDSIGARSDVRRDRIEAQTLAELLHGRLLAGEDMGSVASRLNDDPGGKQREGDLGWIHRGTPDLPVFIERAFTKPVGWLSSPQLTTAGFVILRRDA